MFFIHTISRLPRRLWWRGWFGVFRAIVRVTANRSVVNHENYIPLAGKLNSWAYGKHWNAVTRLRRLSCRCGRCEKLELPFPRRERV
jgi:hypothetical protein